MQGPGTLALRTPHRTDLKSQLCDAPARPQLKGISRSFTRRLLALAQQLGVKQLLDGDGGGAPWIWSFTKWLTDYFSEVV
jgi:hypothetical protein